MSEGACTVCEGRRLRRESLFVEVAGISIAALWAMTVQQAMAHVTSLSLTSAQAQIAEGALREIVARLGFLLNVGLDYLTLDRLGPTLSGGEARRRGSASRASSGASSPA